MLIYGISFFAILLAISMLAATGACDGAYAYQFPIALCAVMGLLVILFSTCNRINPSTKYMVHYKLHDYFVDDVVVSEGGISFQANKYTTINISNDEYYTLTIVNDKGDE